MPAHSKEEKKAIKPPIPKMPMPKMGGKTSWRGFMIYAILGALVFAFFIFTSNPASRFLQNEPLSRVIWDVRDNKVEVIEVDGENLSVKLKTGQQYTSRKEESESIYRAFEAAKVDPADTTILVRDRTFSDAWVTILTTLLPLGLMVLFFFFIFRQAREGASSVFSFGQSRARQFTKDMPKVTFNDVAGVDEAKQELQEVVDFLKHPEKYRAVGARTPKGVLLVGPAGTGKTLLAKSLAGEAGVPFFSVAGSEFMEMLVGVGASVTGDTPVLIRDENGTKLMPIAEFVDKFYQSEKEGYVVKVKNAHTLGFEGGKPGFWGYKNGEMINFERSSWKSVSGVFRHKVSEIYEIEYLGGKIRTTGDHSVFVRRSGRMIPTEARNLKVGDLLIELLLNVRLQYQKGISQQHKILAHNFPDAISLELDVWNDDPVLWEKYQYATEMRGQLYQFQIAREIGVSQMTVSNWQREVHMPQLLSRKLVKLSLPDRIKVTPELMKLFGFYTAEGRCGGHLEFVFGSHEKDLHEECTGLMRQVFGLEAVLEETDTNSLRIKYYSHHLGRFFAKHCGNGSYNKHVPEFMWDLPKEYFLAYLEGYTQGDGYITKTKKLSATSVSKQLILELSWLCSMHGIKVGIKHEILSGGRMINGRGKPLPKSEFWTLIIGKNSNPFLEEDLESPYQFKRAIVKRITKRKYDGFVYDLCGVTNEAFFGGEKPVLLHNSRVRDLFAQAKRSAPSIIFIDEIESIGRMRGLGFSGGHDEREQTLNQILVEMDGFTPNENVLVTAASNRPDLLDPALTRPGRFDRRVVLDLPDIEGRKAIIKIHMRGKPFDKEVDIERMAKRTVGFSGADLANMLNEAAILAARDTRKEINNLDLEEAATKVKLGPQRKRMQSVEERKMTAYHEGGHAMVAHFLPNVDPVHRISIVARGVTGGHTLVPPSIDRYTETKTRLLERIATLLGGRAAEELIFGEFTTGAASDLEIASSLAREMVTEFGMSDLGPTIFAPRPQFGIWPTMGEPTQVSPDLAAKIDQQVAKIIDAGYKRAREVLQKHRSKLDLVAATLLEKETLERDEFEKLVGKPVGNGETKFKIARPAKSAQA